MAVQLKALNVYVCRIACLGLILILVYSILCLSIFLRAKGAVDSTTLPGIDFSIGFSIPTIVVVGVRGYLIFRHRQKQSQTISPSTASPRLDWACTRGVQCFTFLWTILACCNLLVALRAPVCLSEPLQAWQGDPVRYNWRYGLSCRLHRAVVALSILTALSVCLLSFLDNVARLQNNCGRGGGSSTRSFCWCWRLGPKSGCPRSSKHPRRHHNLSVPSISSSQTASEVDKDDRLFLVPERRPSRLEHEQWLQRRNSLSSQRAIYPHRYYSLHNHHSAFGPDLRARYNTPYSDFDPRLRIPPPASSYGNGYGFGYGPYGCYAPSSRYSSTLRSVSEGQCLDLGGNRNSSMTSSQLSALTKPAGSSRPSTLSSSSTFTSSLSSSRSRASSNPEKLALANKTAGSSRLGSLSPTAAPPLPPFPAAPAPAWSPSLHHTPLSADPTIRALSTGTRSRNSAILSHSRSSPALLAKLQSPQGQVLGTSKPNSEHVPGKTSVSSSGSATAPVSSSAITTPTPFLAVPAPTVPSRAAGHSLFPHVAANSNRTTEKATTSSNSTTATTSAGSKAPKTTADLRRPPLASTVQSHQQHDQAQHQYARQPFAQVAGNRSLSAHRRNQTKQTKAQRDRHLEPYYHRSQSRHVGKRDPSVSVYSASSYATERTAMTSTEKASAGMTAAS